jgi:hypothetical protein
MNQLNRDNDVAVVTVASNGKTQASTCGLQKEGHLAMKPDSPL